MNDPQKIAAELPPAERRDRTMTDAAREEAFRRYDGDRIIDECTGEEVSHDDWGYSETARAAFVAGAEWQASLPPTDAEILRAVDAFMRSQGETGDGPSLVHKNMHAALTAAREARR